MLGLGTAAFSGAAGEARYAIKGDNTFAYLETDAIDLTATDFVL